MKKATERQIKYLISLMTQHFGDYRKEVLKTYWYKSTKDIDFELAYTLIEKLCEETLDRNFIADKIYEVKKNIWQNSLF